MKRVLWGLPMILWVAISAPANAEEAVRISPTDPQPTYNLHK
jgi:hypothetical protein